MSDFLRSILNKATASAVDKWRMEGKTTEEIEMIVKSRTETVMEDVIDKACNDYIEYMKAHMFENDLIWASKDAEFSAKQMQKWGKCFVASRMMYTIAIEAAELYLKHITEDNPPDDFAAKRYTFYSLLHLHGRACQIFLEVLTLMKEGFADGAYARSRSLYEISCVASFIKKYGETVAEQFYKQSNADYTERSYTWANCIKENGQKVKSFKQIQELCDLPKPWKEGYDFTCLLTHASPQGTFGRLSNGIDMKAIPVGRSDYGIKTPAEHSALCLQWISSVYFTLFPTMDSLSYVKVLSKWSEIIREMYYTTHDEVFAEAIKAGKAQ